MAPSEPVKEALDHLLDPLDLSAASGEPASEDAAADLAAPPAATYASRTSSAGVTLFFARVRRSRRLLYKIPRLLLAWTALILGVCGLIWITFSVVGLR
jgi:hypothetical protein